jgi:hypothetical protein
LKHIAEHKLTIAGYQVHIQGNFRSEYFHLTFEVFNLLAHHGQIQWNVMLMITDDAQKFKLQLMMHLNTADAIKQNLKNKQLQSEE